MKRVLAAAIAMIGLTTAAQAETEFEGALCFSSAAQACVDDGWAGNECFSVRYAPRGVDNNGANTELSLFSRTFAVGFEMPSGNPVRNSPASVQVAKVARGGYTFAMGFRFSSQNPAAPTTATQNITFAGSFTDWDGIPDCDMGFRGSVTRRQ